MKRNGFTLIELLSAVVILGIVAVIAVQSYYVLIKNNDESKYQYYWDIVKAGVDLHLEAKLNAMEDGDCYGLEYKTLVEKNFIKEEDIVCEGTLFLRKNGRRYDYDDTALSCRTKSSNKVLKEAQSVDSTGCKIIY